MTISTNAAALVNTTLATRAIHAGQEPDPTTGTVVTPIYMTSTFKQDGVGGLRNGYDYSRSVNPTRNSFDAQLAAVEGAKYALSFSSGLAAIDVLLRATLKPGDNILLGNDVYGGTYRLLAKVFVPWGIGLDVVDITDTAAVAAALEAKQYRYIWWRRLQPAAQHHRHRCDRRRRASARHQGRGGQHVRLPGSAASARRRCRRGRVFDHQVHRRAFRCGRRRDRAQRRRNPRRGRVPAERAGAVPSPFDSWLDIRG